MEERLRANIARTVYEVWNDMGRPRVISAHDVLDRYRQAIGEISSEDLNEELYLIEDQDAPFMRVQLPWSEEELGNLGLRDIYADRLLRIAE